MREAQHASPQTRARVLDAIRACARRGNSRPDIRGLAALSGVSTRAVMRALADLEAAGSIRRHWIEIVGE